jgi:hypothetical protein
MSGPSPISSVNKFLETYFKSVNTATLTNFLSAQAAGDDSLRYGNGDVLCAGMYMYSCIIKDLNAKFPSASLSDYQSPDELGQMFSTAYASGEAGLTPRDRVMLRILYATSTIILNYINSVLPSPVVADAAGMPVGFSIPSPVKNFIYDMSAYNGNFLVVFHDGAQKGLIQGASIDYINKYNPYAKYATLDEFKNELWNPSPTTPRNIWTLTSLAVAPLYITWLATNKWNLDTAWYPSWA